MGYNLIQKIRKLELDCDKLGFMMCHSKYGHYSGLGDVVAVTPKDENVLPIYSRDAELFCGTISELEVWLKGVQWSRNYDYMLFGKTHESKRERKEQDYRNQKLVRILKEENDRRST